MAEASYHNYVISFIILPSGEVLISFNKDNSSNFSGAKRCDEASQGVYFLRIREKTLTSNLVFVVVLVLESKGI